jgi:intracellular multiplication protein IcmD
MRFCLKEVNMMLKKKISIRGRQIIKALATLALIGGSLLIADAALADNTYVTLGTVAKSVDNTVGQLATVLVDVSLIAGIGFIMASFFKFHQHKQNPQQVQMSQGISLLLIGCGLTLIPLLIPTASVAVLGSNAKTPSKIGGDSIHKLIGSGT